MLRDKNSSGNSAPPNKTKKNTILIPGSEPPWAKLTPLSHAELPQTTAPAHM